MLEHPALRHVDLSCASLRQRADGEAITVLDRAQAIAVERIARETRAQQALATLQLRELRAVPDPWHAAAKLEPVRGLLPSDLRLALMLHFAERDLDGGPPQFGRTTELAKESWRRAVEDAVEGWGQVRASAEPAEPLPLARPSSHLWATFIDEHPAVQINAALLVTSLDPDGFMVFARSAAYDDGMETWGESCAAAREALTAIAGAPFPREAPSIRIEPAPPAGPASTLRAWLCDWLKWETRVGAPIELKTYLGVGTSEFELPDALNAAAAGAKLCYLLGVENLDVDVDLSNARLNLTTGNLGIVDVYINRVRSVLWKLRKGLSPDRRRDPDLIALGLPLLQEFRQAAAALYPDLYPIDP